MSGNRQGGRCSSCTSSCSMERTAERMRRKRGTRDARWIYRGSTNTTGQRHRPRARSYRASAARANGLPRCTPTAEHADAEQRDRSVRNGRKNRRKDRVDRGGRGELREKCGKIACSTKSNYKADHTTKPPRGGYTPPSPPRSTTPPPHGQRMRGTCQREGRKRVGWRLDSSGDCPP